MLIFGWHIERGDMARLALQPYTGLVHHRRSMMQTDYTVLPLMMLAQNLLTLDCYWHSSAGL